MVLNHRARRALPALSAAAVLLMSAWMLPACGGASSTSSSSPGTAAGRSPFPEISAGSAAGVTDYLSYVGGTSGSADAANPAITIGWVNVEGGPTGSTPEATRAAQAAVRYVNTKLGGIGGHPLALRVCTIASAEEEGQRCGQQLLNDADVPAVAFGNVFVGDASFNSVMAGQKPLLVGVSDGPSVSTAKNTFVLFGDLTHVFGPWGTYARDVLHARTAALIYNNIPGHRSASVAVRKGLEDAGIKVTSVAFETQATDLIGPVTAAGAQTADVIVPIVEGHGCVGVAKALKQLGNTKPVVATPDCLSPDVAQGFGGDLPRWTYGVAQTLPGDVNAPDVKAYLEASAQVGLSKEDATRVFAALAWSVVLTYAKIFTTIGPDKVDPQTVTTQLRQFTGPVIMGAPELKCGQFADAPAICNNQTEFYTYQGKGVFTQASGWLRPAT